MLLACAPFPRALRSRALLLLVASSTMHGLPAPASADDTHGQTLLVGDRSMGMGNAFTGLANDASASFYNPAGLPFHRRSTVAGGLYLQAFEELQIDDALRPTFGTFDLDSDSAPTFPAFAAVTLRLGRRDEDGLRPHVLAFSSFRSRSDSRRALVAMRDPARGVTDTFEIEESDRLTWYGLSYGARLPREWAIGVSLFLVRRGYRSREDETHVIGGTPVGPGRLAGATLTERTGRLKHDTYLFAPRVGLLHRFSPRLQVGLLFQPPGLEISQRARLRRQLNINDGSVSPADGSFQFASDSVAVDVRLPWELRGGLAWLPNENMTMTADLQVVGPLRERRFLRLDDSAAPIPGARFAESTIRRRPAVNLSVGAELLPGEHTLLRVGFLTDFSTAPKPVEGADYTPPRIHRFGVTASLGAHQQRRGMAVTVTALWGRGRALALSTDPTSFADFYTPTTAQSRSIFLSITGATETVEALAERVVERILPGDAVGGEVGEVGEGEPELEPGLVSPE